jgi:hypothetical protein
VGCDSGYFGVNEGTEGVGYSYIKKNVVLEYEYVQRIKQERLISKHKKAKHSPQAQFEGYG